MLTMGLSISVCWYLIITKQEMTDTCYATVLIVTMEKYCIEHNAYM